MTDDKLRAALERDRPTGTGGWSNGYEAGWRAALAASATDEGPLVETATGWTARPAASATDEGPRPLAGHPWLVRLTCCGRSDGAFAAPTYEEAAAFRESYTTGVGTVGHPLTPNGHQRTAVIEDALAARPAVPALDERVLTAMGRAGLTRDQIKSVLTEYAALSPKEPTDG